MRRNLWEINRRVLLAYCLVMLLFFPLFMDETLYAGITAAKHSFFVVFTCLSLIILLFSSLLSALSGGLRGSLRPLPLSEAFMLAYLLVCLLAFLFSPYRQTYNLFIGAGRNEGLLTQFLYVAVFLTAAAFGGKRKDMLLSGFGFATVILCLIGILQYYGQDILGLYPTGYDWYNSDFITTIGNKNMVSALLCMALAVFCAAHVLLEETGRGRRALPIPALLAFFLLLAIENDSGYVGVLALQLLLPLLCADSAPRLYRLLSLYGAMAVTAALWMLLPSQCDWSTREFSLAFQFTPGAALVLALGALLFAAAWFFRKKGCFSSLGPRRFRCIWGILLVCFVVLGFLLLYVLPLPQGIGALYEVQQMLHGNFDESFGTNRLFVWKRALELVKTHPLLGTGPDSFIVAYAERFGEETLAFTGQYYDAAHNEYLQILCNCGILGLLAYLGGLVSLFLRALRKLPENPALGVLLLTTLCYCVQAFFSFSISITAPIFWIALGLLAHESKP